MTNFISGLYSGMSLALIIGYVVLLSRYIKFWKALPKWSVPEQWSPKTLVSLIIPARNECDNIEACLQSIANLNYPMHLCEIIVVDDHSEDGTPAIVRRLIKDQLLPQKYNIKLIQSTGHGKKAALTSGIHQANGALIVTTDADCIVPENWMRYLVSYFETHNSKFIAAPVNFHKEKTVLEKFQSLDYMGMMLLTGAGIHGKFGWMSNGANLAYPREVFHELKGFSGIDQLASGDDMLFMQKVAAKYPNKIGFVKNQEATVLSHAKTTWGEMLQQRIRWASKTDAYDQPRLVWTQSFVFLYCALIITGIPLCFLGKTSIPFFLITLIMTKYITDYFFLKRASNFFGRGELMEVFPVAEWMHTLYIFLTGLGSVIKKKHYWKGREVK
jgi:cellulose synthase/poly-beta-1,6-N-acetylglucosamine synthase-like glycosyltransferase